MPRWIEAFPLDDVPPGSAKVLHLPEGQIAVFRTVDGDVHAVDNRCPHEGYPLRQGVVVGTTLTCSWHNFKYDLRDGTCLKGGEDVRRFPTRVIDGALQIDIEAPDPGPRIAKGWASWGEALRAERTDQVLRDTVRLLRDGVDPKALVAALARYDGAHGEFGATHVLPVCADVLRWLPRYPGAQAVIPLAVPLDLAARNHVRRPARPVAEPLDPGPPVLGGALLAAAVEAEDLTQAEGLLRGAIRRGFPRAILEDWLFDAATAHFLDFGHALIYQTKVFDLLDAVGPEAAEDVLVGHLVGIVYGIREDALPRWAPFRGRMTEATRRFPEWRDNTGPSDLEQAVVSAPTIEAVDRVLAALDDGAAPEAIADDLVLAASERVLRFDASLDGRRDVQDDWLSVTHILTFAWAARDTVRRWRSPLALRALLYAARMIASHRVLDGERAPIGTGGTDLVDAIRRRDPVGALACDPMGAREALEDVVLEDLATRGIYVAHHLKTLTAGFDAALALGDPRPALAAVRVIATPMAERRTRRLADEALRLVLEGKTPRVLAL